MGGLVIGGRELFRGFSGYGEFFGFWGCGRLSDFDYGFLFLILDRMFDFWLVRDMRDCDMYSGGGWEIFWEREWFYLWFFFERGVGFMDWMFLEFFVDRDREWGDIYCEKRMLDGVDYRVRLGSFLWLCWGWDDKDCSSFFGWGLYCLDRYWDMCWEERWDWRDVFY